MTRREVRKIMARVEAAGGCFYLTHHDTGRGGYFDCDVPTAELASTFGDTVRDNADLIFEILKPRTPSSRRKKTCRICRSGSGCRTRYKHAQVKCPNCGHGCHVHNRVVYGFDGKELIPACCGYPVAPFQRCPCPGWPVPPPVEKPRQRKTNPTQQENLMGLLIPDEDLRRSLDKYEAEQARLQAAQPRVKTHAQIACEIVREDPSVTVQQLVEASGRPPSWVRRTLKAAGLKAAQATRKRGNRGEALVEQSR
ncbi:MAG: hypothetical protein WB952_05295 [Terriglobales bacterium]